MAFEHRFEQYDIFMRKPPPLVDRAALRRARAHGRPRQRAAATDEDAVRALVPALKANAIEAIAIGYMHASSRRHARTAHARHPAGGAARSVDLALQRGLAGDPRVRALVDRGRQCLCPAGHGPLSRQARRGAQAAGLRLPAVHDHVRASLTALETARKFPIRPVESGRRRRHPPRPCPSNVASTRCCPSTWAARRPRSA